MAYRRHLVRRTLASVDGTALFRLTEEHRLASSTYGRAFVTIFAIDAAQLLRNVRDPTALRLWTMLPTMLAPDDWRRLDQRVLANELTVSQPSVSRGLTVLMRAGVVERSGKGPGVRYRMSPRVMWRGTVGAYHAQERQEARNYAAEANAYRLQAQLSLALPEPTRGKRKAKKEDQ
jgi:DNA-binding transcriptional ArsR family regulator